MRRGSIACALQDTAETIAGRGKRRGNEGSGGAVGGLVKAGPGEERKERCGFRTG